MTVSKQSNIKVRVPSLENGGIVPERDKGVRRDIAQHEDSSRACVRDKLAKRGRMLLEITNRSRMKKI